jgi:enoyl-CoA hydratase/carnithine racemase
MIDCSVHNRIGIITLNRAEKLNALNGTMIHAIHDSLTCWENDPDVDAVVIRSAVERAFSAGGDLQVIYDLKDQSFETMDAFFRFEYALNRKIRFYKKPYIALLHGISMGGGLGISLHGSCRIVSESLQMTMPECAIGFFPDVLSSVFFQSAPGFLNRFLAVTGYRMNAADALYTGLATHYMTKDTVDVFLEALCKSPTEGCVEEVLHELLDYFAGGEVPLLSELERHQDFIDTCFSEKTLEGVLASMNGHKDPWVWKILDDLECLSPLSLKVAFELSKRARKISFEDLYALDFRLASNLVRYGDFLEGIRAKIIDKDHNPQWRYKTLEDVPDEVVAGFFRI